MYLLLDGPGIVADVEQLEVELLRGSGPPEPEDVDRPGAVSGNQCGAGLAEDALGGDPSDVGVSVDVGVILSVAPEPHVDHVVGLGELPRVAMQDPLVGLLHLPAILERLLEDCSFKLQESFVSTKEDWEYYVRPVYVAMSELVKNQPELSSESQVVINGFQAEYSAAGKYWDMILWIAKNRR